MPINTLGSLSRWCGRQLSQESTRRRTGRRRPTASPVAAIVETLEDRILLSSATGVYDENVVQANSVDVTAEGSSMTSSQFAADIAAAWADNSGGVIDGSAFDSTYSFGQDQFKLLDVFPDPDFGLVQQTQLSDPLPISGDAAFSTISGGAHQATLYFAVENGQQDENVLQFGLTVLGQNADYGTVYVFGHLARGGDVILSHEVTGGGTEDVFYGFTAPSGDYFVGFTVAYSGTPAGDAPLYFDDIGFITGNANGESNVAPVAVDDAYTVEPDTLLLINAPGVLGNDFDADGNLLTTYLVQGPDNGILQLNDDGSFYYMPDAGFVGSDQFTYAVWDGAVSSNFATVSLTVGDPGQPPVAQDDAYSVSEDATLNVSDVAGVLANDVDPEAAPLAAVLVSGPGHGTLNLAADGSFTYTPDADFFGTDTFSYQADDGTWNSNVATVTITVTGVNDAPLALDDSYTLNEDESLNVAVAAGVLANDSDADSDPLSAVLVSGPSHGTLSLNADGSFTYTPEADFSGTDSFAYRAHDGVLDSAAATVTLTVTASNDAPVAHDDAFALSENESLVVPAGPTSLLANDSDAEGDPLTAVLVSGPSHGTLNLAPDGSFTYTPAANYYGTDSFTYRASDGSALSNIATATLTIAAVNEPPVAQDDAWTVNEDETLVVELDTVASLSMVSEPGDYIGQGLTYDLDQSSGSFTATRNFDNGVTIHYESSTDPGDYWVLNFAAPGEAVLTAGQYTGATRYPFQAPDAPGLSVYGQGRGSNTLTGQFTVQQVVYGPSGEVLVFDATFEQHSEGFEPALTGHIQYISNTLLANDVDPDGDPLSAVLVNGPANGSLSLNADGTFQYTPDADFSGTDTFTYRASDGTAESSVTTVTINVAPVNDAPVAVGQNVSTDEDTPLSGVVTATDVDGDPLQYALTQDPSNGALVFNADGTWTYTPDADFNGSDSFSFTADDGAAVSAPAIVTITVLPVNDAPLLSGAEFSLAENSANGTAVGAVSGTDVDGEALSYSIAAGNGSGAFAIDSSTGEITVADSSQLDFETTPVFVLTVRAGDTGGLYAEATVTIQLTDVVETLTVAIDVVPGDSSNTIRSKGNGREEVAILSTSQFDATTVDIDSLRFGRTGTEDSLSRTPQGAPRYRIDDVNGDGLLDLVVTFERDLMDFKSGDTTGILTGQTLSGIPIEGEDDVTLIGNWP